MAEERTAPTPGVDQHFYMTRESQNAGGKNSDAQKLSYVGMRNLADLDYIEEQDILSARGTIRGRKNRVRAGLANFENPKALEKRDAERGKVVVYITSFRGVRATFEDCRYVLDLFHNLRVRVITKDIYLSQFYHREMEGRLTHSYGGGHICVPQIFIGGQHIGGKKELEELNEVGKLRKILEDCPQYETANNCKVCGGFEFIPCRKCGGSKNSTANKFTSEFRALRCTHCDVNGMEECPECVERKKELEKKLKRKELQRVQCKRENREVQGTEKREGNESVRANDREQVQCRDKNEGKKPETVEDVCEKKGNITSEVQNETQQETHAGNIAVAMDDNRGDYAKGEVQEQEVVRREEKARGSDLESNESDSEENITDIEALEQYIQDIVF